MMSLLEARGGEAVAGKQAGKRIKLTGMRCVNERE